MFLDDEKRGAEDKLKRALKIGINHLLLLICSAIIGFILLLIVYFIPQDAIYENTRESVETLYNEWSCTDYNYEEWKGIKGTIIDYFTDGLILNTTYTEKGNLVEENGDCSLTGYGRYWHGYQIVLRPLLMIMSVSSIRFLNMIVQLALIILLFGMLIKREKGHLVVPYFVMWISLIPNVLFNCFQYSSCFYAIMLTSLFIVLLWQDDRSEQFFLKCCLVFELGGIILAYLDILTYPFVALGVPLILFLSLDVDCKEKIKMRIKEIFGFSASWIIGYLGMWFAKWGIATMFTDSNIIKSAWEAITYRTSHGNGETQFTWIGTIARNASFLNNGIFAIIFVGIFLLFAGYCYKYCVKINIPVLLAIFIVSLYPFVWYFFTMNHSNMHVAFTWRELVISIYGIVSILFVNITGVRRKQEKNGN